MVAKSNSNKVSVSERALIKRVNRQLAPANRRLLKNRATRTKGASSGKAGRKVLTKREIELGTFFIVETFNRGSAVVLKHVNLESYARGLDVIEPYEFLDTDAE
jgi:hypothetical protein